MAEANAPQVNDEERIAELRAIVEGIKDRVRARYPYSSVPLEAGVGEPVHVPLADLMPMVHARDAAQAKMASIGSVNPRAGGLTNNAIQAVKRTVARGLGWFVRDQVVFNRGVMACIEASIETLSEVNRSFTALAAGVGQSLHQWAESAEPRVGQAEADSREAARVAKEVRLRLDAREALGREDLRALRSSLETLREGVENSARALEQRVAANETRYAELLRAQHGEFSESLRRQHAEFENSLARAGDELQTKMAGEIARVKLEYERVIHNELRVVRQRGVTGAAEAPPARAASGLDYLAFANRFRGSAAYVRKNQEFYAGRFAGMQQVLDLGCGQGEFLDVMRQAGVGAHGIDASAESVAICRGKGLRAEEADLFVYLNGLEERSLDGIFCSQVVEHLAPPEIARMIGLCAAKLREGGLLAIETPNPGCLAIFATHFYLDPTHVRPVPSGLLAFYLEENGMGGIEVVERFPAEDSFPELEELPEGVRRKFFGGLDYAIFARKL